MEKNSDSRELDLSVSKRENGKRKTKTDRSDRSDVSIGLGSNTLVKPSVSLDPTTLVPQRSGITSLLSLNHLRLWENPITASAISAAAAMTHLMDINNASLSAAIGDRKSGKSSEEHKQSVSRNMCLICGRVVRNHGELERHMLTHSMEKPYQCVRCDKTFKNLRNQQSHQFLFHNITDGLTPNRMQGLLMSQKKRKVNGDKPLDVSMVKRNKSLEYNYIESQRWHTPDISCNNDDNNKSLSAINSMNSLAFPCTSCHKTFATHVDLKAHLMRHLTQHPFVCLACGKGFKYQHSLNFHIKSYHGVNNDNNNFASSSVNKDLDADHKLKIDESEGKNITADTLSSENTHGTNESDYDDETSIDEDEDDDDGGDSDNGDGGDGDGDDGDDGDDMRKGICFDYGAPANLAPRIQIKSEKMLITLLEGIHPVTEQSYILYKCCICGYAFPSLEPITVHIQTAHLTNSKDFTCDKCGATFKWRSELQLHEKLHKAMDQQENSGKFHVSPFVHQNSMINHDFSSPLSPSHNNNNNNNNNNSPINGKDNTEYLLPNRMEEESAHEKSKSTKARPRIDKVQHKQNANELIVSEASDSNVNDDDFTVPSNVAFPQKFPTAVGDIEETAPGQFKCRFCDKTFDRIFSVHRHERVHTGFKPCICKTCGRGFSEKRNLRHHIIRFHSDGSGRELLKRNRKDKSSGNVTHSKRKIATSLKKAALKLLNSSEMPEKNIIESDERMENIENDQNESKIEIKRDNCVNDQICDASNMCSISNVNNTIPSSSSSSSHRRKGKPSKKIITPELIVPESPVYNEEDNDEEEDLQGSDKSKEDDAEAEPELNPCDFLETKLRCHGAFFSSYSPRLGVVEKPIERNEACRPTLGPDGKYLYPCSYCNKNFCSLSDLNRHMNFHEDVRPFKCEYCNYQSRTNSQLKVHMMRHAGIKQFLCQVCNYNGVTQSDLNRHCKTRSHSLRSANICPLCALGFSTRALLEDHILKFHEATDSTSSTSSEKSNKNVKTENVKTESKNSSERNNNDYSFPTKKFSVSEILN